MASALYLCLHVRDFAAQAVTRAHSGLRHRALAILTGTPPLEQVFGLNRQAREIGVAVGMSRVQAESFAGLTMVRRERAQEDHALAELMDCAERFSPRVEAIDSPDECAAGASLLLDIANSERLLGSARQIAEALRREMQRLGYEAGIAVSSHAYAAVLAAGGCDGITILASGGEAEALAPLPLTVLALDAAQAQILAAWGVRTVGQLAALPLQPLIARLGQDGHRLHRMARGAYDHLLVPEQEAADAELVERVELDTPVELLEPLLFLLSRALEQLTLRARERALAIAAVETCLVLEDAADSEDRSESWSEPISHLLTAADVGHRSEHRRTVRPALPEQDYHTLLKLVQLDLELHPPPSGIVGFTMRARPAPAPKVQQGLFAAQAPEAGRLEVLLARLRKLMGEGRVGAPELLDSHAPEGFRVNPFAAATEEATQAGSQRTRTTSALRMLRPPLAVRIGMNGAAPANLLLEGKRFAVETCSGPWRTSGAWWTHPAWCREEWDVVVKDEARNEGHRCLRLAHEPGGDGWYVLGMYD
jgi:protein ImuB